MGYYSQSNSGALWFFVFLIVAIVMLIFLMRNPNFKNWLNQLFSGIGTTPSQTGTTPSGGGQQGTVTGANIYPVIGPIAATGDTRHSTAGSGSGGGSERDNLGFDCSKCNRETTWIFVPGTGGDWSVKMGSHGRSGGSDDDSIGSQWEENIGGGNGRWRCEGPYGKFSNMSGSGTGASFSGSGQVGLKGVSWSTGSNTNHHEVWYNETGDGQTWTKIAEFDGTSPCGNPFTCPVPASGGGAHCQDTLRIDDNNGSKWVSSSIVEIDPSGGSKSGTITTPSGITPTSTTPTQTTNNNNSGGITPTGTTPTNTNTTPTNTSNTQCPSRCEPLKASSPSTYQACCNGAAVATTARSAKVVMRRSMYSAFQYTPDYWKLSRKRRIGNLI